MPPEENLKSMSVFLEIRGIRGFSNSIIIYLKIVKPGNIILALQARSQYFKTSLGTSVILDHRPNFNLL